jgi:hypothetical protein
MELMVAAGIKGILNFAPIELKCPKKCIDDDCPGRCIIHNINIGPEIENLFYLIHMKEQNDFPDDPECQDCEEREKVGADRIRKKVAENPPDED